MVNRRESTLIRHPWQVPASNQFYECREVRGISRGEDVLPKTLLVGTVFSPRHFIRVQIHRSLLLNKTMKALVSLLLLIPSLQAASYFKHITIDGSFEDWAGVPPAIVDPQDAPTATDIKNVYIAHDDQYIYIRFTLYAPGDPFTSHNNIFIDADANAGTGFSTHVGSEMLIQSGVGYQEKNGDFNEGGINGLDWAAAPATVATDFELRISQRATYESDGTPVFTGLNVSLLLEAEDPNFNPVEFAPDSGGIQYELTAPPPQYPPTLEPANLVTLGGDWRFNDTGVDLGTAWREPSYDRFFEDNWSIGPGMFGFSPNPGVYPAPLRTPLTVGRPTYYFRTTFEWNYDSDGIVLIASNYLSDGAVLYLNGAEVGRLRVPDHPVTYNSRASGGPATAGQVERLALPPNALVVGTNLLAVEVHQTANDTTDLVFGLALIAAPKYPVFITDSTEPADRTVVEGDSTTFLVRAAGSEPITYRWFKNGSAIPGATNATYTIPFVQASDAGNYFVEVSNGLAFNVRSRTAVLTTMSIPVSITNPAEPADRSVRQGSSTTFTVQVAGSLPRFFQWYKNNVPIPNATNDTYTIPQVVAGDAGSYYVIASNTAPSAVQSRTAQLSVITDIFPPTVSGVSGSPNKVRITFSEPIDPVTATQTGNYTLDGGVSVNSAIVDPNDARTVILTTTAQTLRTRYTLTINGVKDRFNNTIAAGTRASFVSTILIDGSFDDWAGVPVAISDPQDATDAEDWKDIFITHDDDYLYFRVTLHSPGDPTDFHNNIFFDTDNNAGTGYPFRLGSEMLIQGGGGYQQKNGHFNEGNITGLGWAIAPGAPGTDFEFRVSRHARYASNNLPVFTANAVTLLFESENNSYATRDTAPDSGAFTYRWALEPVGVRYVGSDVVEISWTGPGVLQSRASLSEGDWVDEFDQSNPHLDYINFDPIKFYRLIQR
jgi:hypothetical protein